MQGDLILQSVLQLLAVYSGYWSKCYVYLTLGYIVGDDGLRGSSVEGKNINRIVGTVWIKLKLTDTAYATLFNFQWHAATTPRL